MADQMRPAAIVTKTKGNVVAIPIFHGNVRYLERADFVQTNRGKHNARCHGEGERARVLIPRGETNNKHAGEPLASQVEEAAEGVPKRVWP